MCANFVRAKFVLLCAAALAAVGGQDALADDDRHHRVVEPVVLARDDFDGKMDLKWTIRSADPAHASLTNRPGFLTITTQYGDLIDRRNSAKNVYLTRIPSGVRQFGITTCLDGFQPQADWNQAGLLCMLDMDNYVKFTVENKPGGGRRLVMIGEFRGRPVIKSTPDPFPKAEKLWQRIIKRGADYQFYASSDGIHFKLVGSQSWGQFDRLHTPRWMGVMAINGPSSSAPNIDASFDFIELSELETDRVTSLLNETLSHLELHPRDTYAQYVALQLARQAGRLDEVARRIRSNSTRWNPRARRMNQVNLFSIFSGQLAIQESLQLDALAPEDIRQQPLNPDRRVGPPPVKQPGEGLQPQADNVAVSTLQGPVIESHPWQEMLAGQSPQVTGLALKVPSDYYFVSFGSANKLLKLTDLATNWGAHVLSQSERDARTQLVGQRLKKQLALETNPVMSVFFDDVVSEVAITGSDLFLREGSDVAMLFQLKQPAVFRTQMDQFLTTAENSREDARRDTDNYLGVDYTRIATPDRQIFVHSAYPTPELHVRSNSLEGLRRVLEAVLGHDAQGDTVEPLGATDEFRYVRTLLPEGAAEEDGLIYFSDPFVRQMTSAELRLTERRRLVCYNHLRMIGHAALLHQQLTGEQATSLGELDEAHCTPGKFGVGRFACPDHGKYELASDGLTGVCSKHGYANSLTPCSEVDVSHVTEQEAAAYRQFVTEYSRFWQQFFDPIVVRLQVFEDRVRAETIILPLINNSIYANLVRSIGGEPEALDHLPVPERNIFTFAVRLNKREILEQLGMEGLLEGPELQDEELRALEQASRSLNSLRQISLAMLGYESTRESFPQAELLGKDDKPLLSWRVKLLPYIGEKALFDEFRFDEPWDSPHNEKLIKRMPGIFRSSNKALSDVGKTRFVVPRGEGTVFAADNRKVRMRSIRDGTSNTILLLEVDDPHAVVWTKPSDLDIDMSRPQQGLLVRESGNFLAAMCDGSALRVNQSIPQPALSSMLTFSGGEVTNWRQFVVNRTPRRRSTFIRLPAATVSELRLGELLVKGVGNQVGFHLYDADPMIDMNIARFMGLSFGNFRGRGFADELLFAMPLVGAINGPVYLSIPIEDKEVVDSFLERLDQYLARKTRRLPRGRFFSVDEDFYQLTDNEGSTMRTYSFEFGPIKWRFFWTRIDDVVYIASKREVLDDLKRLSQKGATLESSDDDVGQALIRLRPHNWNQVLSAYQLGWEENRREACLNNLGPLTSLSRALRSGDTSSTPLSETQLEHYAARVFDVQHFCPDGGRYEVSSDGKQVKCSVHGTALHPQQNAQPDAIRRTGWQVDQFHDVSIRFMFLEDGLRAIATLERTKDQ